MITLELISQKLKEHFPSSKLKKGYELCILWNSDGSHGLCIFGDPTCVRDTTKMIPKNESEKFLLTQIDNLINETYKVYWG